ncbi:MAG: TIR domain-containing protein [Hyphomicrobiaceae bacterium]|nr:TIR domain-containing protein [Hyphomicrobiaceae bacterium]
MPRKVFFSFHYDDVTRANVVRNSDVITRQYQTGVRFYDKSLWEEAKKQGAQAIKRMINGALEGSTVTCVLIGQQTWQRPWVRYEILKSMARGNGILGVEIHDVGFSATRTLSSLAGLLTSQPAPAGGLLGLGGNYIPPRATGLAAATLLGSGLDQQPPSPGPSPLRYLGYINDRARGIVTFYEIGPDNQWRQHQHVEPISVAGVRCLSGMKDADNLANLFPVYGWKRQDGAKNLHQWVEAAARQAGR